MAKARSVFGLNIQSSTGQNAALIVRTRLEEVYSWAQYIGEPQRSHELHNMRIAIKRLRYTLEIFQDTLPAASEQIIEELTQLQDELGTLHDSDVLITLLHLSFEQESIPPEQKDEQVPSALLPEERKDFVADQDLAVALVNPHHPPSTEQRKGLELVLQTLQHQREAQYEHFRQHWEQLQKRSFHREILDLLDA